MPSSVPAVALILGASCAVLIPVPAGLLLSTLTLVCLASLTIWWRGRALAAFLVAVLGLSVAGAALAARARDRALDPRLRAHLDREFGGFRLDTPGPEGRHAPVLTRLRLTEDAALAEDAVLLRASVRAILLSGTWQSVPDEGVRVTVGGVEARDRLADWIAGRTLTAPVTFRRPARYLNAGVADFERDAALDGTALGGTIKSALLVQVDGRATMVEEASAAVRAYVRRRVSRWVTPYDAVAGAIVVAVLIGDRTGLPDDVRVRLQTAGIYHVIAISGGNIAILAGLVLALLMLAGVQGRPAALVTIVVLALYSQVVVAGPSVWRATLMAMLYMAARAMDLRSPPWHALAVAAALMVIVHPLDVRDPGFVLTFGATGALLAGAAWGSRITGRGARGKAAPADRWRRATQRAGWWVVASLLASAAVELTLMPVSAEAFSRVTGAGLVLNLVAVPLMAVIQVAGTLVVLAGPVEAVARVSGWVAAVSASALVESARLVEVSPLLSGRVPPPGPLLLTTYYAGLAMLCAGRRRVRTIGGSLLATSMLAIVTSAPVRWAGFLNSLDEPALRLTVLDVGQAESLLVEAPGADPLLIDTGGAPFGGGFDVGRRVLAPALWARGIRRLGALLVTHGDPDHLGGAPAVLEDFEPRLLWTGIPVPRHEPSRELEDAATRAGIALEPLGAGETRVWGRTRLRVLHPPPPDWERQRVRNDDSVVIEIVYGDVAMLLTGDIGADVERTIVPQLTPARVRILKVAHHGSRTSTSDALLAAWPPDVAIVSCGRGNSFGHPTREVLDRLAAAGARVFRTDRQGAITIETDGKEVRVETFIGNQP